MKMQLVSGMLLFTAALMTVFAAENADEPTPQRRQELLRMLEQDCAVCHGAMLRGDLGPALTPERLAGKSEDSLAQSILEGHEETAMPPWWWSLRENEARWLVKFLLNTRKE